MKTGLKNIKIKGEYVYEKHLGKIKLFETDVDFTINVSELFMILTQTNSKLPPWNLTNDLTFSKIKLHFEEDSFDCNFHSKGFLTSEFADKAWKALLKPWIIKFLDFLENCIVENMVPVLNLALLIAGMNKDTLKR